MASNRIADLRHDFALSIMATADVADPRIEAAFAAVPRERFAGPGPWSIHDFRDYVQTPDDDPTHLYRNVLVALDRARGINIGEPALHARCLEALGLAGGETVIHVGAGSGYYTAILATLAGEGGHIVAYEIDPGLAARCAEPVRLANR